MDAQDRENSLIKKDNILNLANDSVKALQQKEEQLLATLDELTHSKRIYANERNALNDAIESYNKQKQDLFKFE